MSSLDLATSPPAFLARCLPAPSSRPTVTVTWAQSLDSKIAGPGGKRVILSGNGSMLMTHWMRSMHDAIMVGVNTVLLDDPRLQSVYIISYPKRADITVNLLPSDQGLEPPQPIILDPTLRFPTQARMLKVWGEWRRTTPADRGNNIVRQPWILCGDNVSLDRIAKLEEAGARVIPIPLDAEGRIAPNSIPDILISLKLKSVMVEGGSKVLSSFLRSPARSDGTPLVDNVIITVAPIFIGEGVGVVPREDESQLPNMQSVHTETLGKDAIIVCSLVNPQG